MSMVPFETPVLECIENRSSLRKFEQEALKKEEEEAILHAALRAPTAANMMLYSILAVRDEKKKRALAKSCNSQSWIETAPFLLIFLADMQRWEDFYRHCGVPEKCRKRGVGYLKPGEQNLLLASCDALFAAQNAVLAAESLGIGSCYVGHIMDHYEFHQRLFELPPYVFPITMAAFGRAPKGFVRKKTERRFGEKIIFHEDSYHRMTGEELEEAFKSLPYVEQNAYGAENNGQLYYLARHSKSDCYEEALRSVRAALENWKHDRKRLC